MADTITRRDIKQAADDLLEEFLDRSKDLLADRKASGKLLRSLALVARAEAEGIIARDMSFAGYGRIMDMKAPARKAASEDGIARLKEWIQKKGVANFHRGYIKRYGKLPASDVRLVNNIAWGIARGSAKRRRRRGRLKWYNRRKSGMLVELFDKVATAVIDAAPKEVNPQRAAA